MYLLYKGAAHTVMPYISGRQVTKFKEKKFVVNLIGRFYSHWEN